MSGAEQKQRVRFAGGVNEMLNKIMTTLVVVLLTVAGSAWAGGDAGAGEGKAAGCVGCHGAAGEGAGGNPAIAGKDEAEFLKMLQEYKAGTRGEAMMQMFAGQLSEEDMADIAAYYASLGQ